MTSPRTMLGPLTKPWAAPPICSYAMAGCDTCTTVWMGQTCNPKSNAHDFTDCWPPRSGDQEKLDPGVMMGWGLYSPGIACPSGYTTAAMATAGGNTGWGIEYSMLPGETAAACCPPGFQISWIEATNTYAQTCVTTATSTSFSTVQCSSGSFVEFSLMNIPNTVSNTVLSQYVLYAPLYQLNFKASDLPPPQTTAAGGGSNPTSTSAQPPPSSTVPSSTSNPSFTSSTSSSGSTSASGGSSASSATAVPDAPAGGLSTGAKVGVALGSALGAFILAMLAFFLFRRRRRQREAGWAAEPPDDTGSGGKAGLFWSSKKHKGVPAEPELGGEEVRELDGRPVMTELPTRLPSGRVAPQQGPIFRRSDQTWVVTPTEGTFSTLDGHIVSPIGPNDGAYELEGDSETPRQTTELERP